MEEEFRTGDLNPPKGIVTEGITLIFFFSLTAMFAISMLYSLYRSSGICRVKIQHNYFFKAFYFFVVLHNIVRFFLFFALFYLADTNYSKMTPSNQTFAKILFLSFNTPKFLQKLSSHTNLLVSLNVSFRSRFDKFDILKYHPLTYKPWFRVDRKSVV